MNHNVKLIHSAENHENTVIETGFRILLIGEIYALKLCVFSVLIFALGTVMIISE